MYGIAYLHYDEEGSYPTIYMEAGLSQDTAWEKAHSLACTGMVWGGIHIMEQDSPDTVPCLYHTLTVIG